MPIRRGHARVFFNEGAYAEDTMRSGRAGAKALREARRRFECHGRDGTKLPACFKAYLPPPNGRFGMVLRFVRDDKGLALRYLAFGVRHHPRNSNAPSVYDIAHRRLHGQHS